MHTFFGVGFGTITVSDPGAGVAMYVPVAFASITRVGANTAQGSSSGLSLSDGNLGLSTLNWTLQGP